MTIIYCMDSSSWIGAWVRSYPPTTAGFQFVWDGFERLIFKGRLITSREVVIELEKKEDDLHEWVKSHPRLVIESSREIQRSAEEIINRFPKLQKKGFLYDADPWVIALAKERKATVVSQEHLTNSLDKPGIPDVCRELGIPHIPLLKLIKAEF